MTSVIQSISSGTNGRNWQSYALPTALAPNQTTKKIMTAWALPRRTFPGNEAGIERHHRQQDENAVGDQMSVIEDT